MISYITSTHPGLYDHPYYKYSRVKQHDIRDPQMIRFQSDCHDPIELAWIPSQIIVLPSLERSPQVYW